MVVHVIVASVRQDEKENIIRYKGKRKNKALTNLLSEKGWSFGI